MGEPVHMARAGQEPWQGKQNVANAETRANYTFGYLCINTLAVSGAAEAEAATARRTPKQRPMAELLFCVQAKV